MNIIERVASIRNRLKEHGDFSAVADRSGVTYAWLSKFARGSINNPTIGNIAKLEAFFLSNNDKDAA